MQEARTMNASDRAEEELDLALTQLLNELGEVLARLRFAETVERVTCEQYVHSIQFLKKVHPSPQHIEMLRALLAMSESPDNCMNDAMKESAVQTRQT
jgi:hypothetical protein